MVDFPWRVVLPFEDAEEWTKITNILLTPRFASIAEFAVALSQYHYSASLPVHLDAVEEAVQIISNNANDSKTTTNNNNLPPAAASFDFVSEVLPFIQLQVLSLPYHFENKTILSVVDQSGTVTLPRQAVCSLLAAAFFWLFKDLKVVKKKQQPTNNASGTTNLGISGISGGASTTPMSGMSAGFDWSSMMSHQTPHCCCIVHYFDRCRVSPPTGIIKITRKVLQNPFTAQNWMTSTEPLADWVTKQTGNIEDAKGIPQADFANACIGGGVLEGGRVQEEIRFCVNTELLVSMLITPKMADNEAVEIVGSERFSSYSGYGGSFEWSGAHHDSDKDMHGQPLTRVIAFDALVVWNDGSQFSPHSILRELNKAMIAFSIHQDEISERIQREQQQLAHHYIPQRPSSRPGSASSNSSSRPGSRAFGNKHHSGHSGGADGADDDDHGLLDSSSVVRSGSAGDHSNNNNNNNGNEKGNNGVSGVSSGGAPPLLKDQPAWKRGSVFDNLSSTTLPPAATTATTGMMMGSSSLSATHIPTTAANSSSDVSSPSPPTRKLVSLGGDGGRSVGLHSYSHSIATGNWGCGMFGGCAQLKCIIQWLAASQCHRNIHYYVYNQTQLVDSMKNILIWVPQLVIVPMGCVRGTESTKANKTRPTTNGCNCGWDVGEVRPEKTPS
eukprot:TRINITY_DN67231_c15_g1_i3.p1 TRINITY_DN67231_c15_g1~~TRINITY_DN67231_c15_g1_i3.p1  ORF type:complete len:670 (+),score=79.62 TRINITY_DN67231_c15_g1_i3:32-2041(+)